MRCDGAQLGYEGEQSRMQHGADAHVDHAMAGARIEADERRGLGRARALDREARAPARARCDLQQRRHHRGIEPMLAQRRGNLLLFRSCIGVRREMLQRAAAACAEMRADRRRALALAQQRDELGRLALAARGTEPGAHAIARGGEGQIDGAPVVACDAVAARADAVDDEGHLLRLHARLAHGGVRRA